MSRNGMEFVVTTASRGDAAKRSRTPGEKTGCVQQAITDLAPRESNAVAPWAIEPPVSIMSSIRMQRFPRTSPMISTTSTMLGAGRRFAIVASGEPSISAIANARRTPPSSGDTTQVPSPARPESIRCRPINGPAYRWSTGRRKKPWICCACRSRQTTRLAPASVNKSATKRAVTGSRGLIFLS